LLQPVWNGRARPGDISDLLRQQAAQNEGSPSNPEGEEEIVAPISENPAGAASLRNCEDVFSFKQSCA